MPNDAEVYLVIGAILRRQGKWQESTANLEKAVSLNPNDTWPLQNLFFNYQVQHDFDAANRVVDRALAINPKSFSLWGMKAKLAVAERGDLTVAEKGLAEFDQGKARGDLKDLSPETMFEVAMAKANVLLLRRKYPEALEALRQLPHEMPPANLRGLVEVSLLEGTLNQAIGQMVEARAAFLKAKETAEAMVREAPNDAMRHAVLARTLARLGEKDAAIAEGKRAAELLPESVDAFQGPEMTQALAEVYAVTGENARAIETLDGLLSRPSEVTVPLLKIDPTLDGLRNDPAFQAMLLKH